MFCLIWTWPGLMPAGPIQNIDFFPLAFLSFFLLLSPCLPCFFSSSRSFSTRARRVCVWISMGFFSWNLMRIGYIAEGFASEFFVFLKHIERRTMPKWAHTNHVSYFFFALTHNKIRRREEKKVIVIQHRNTSSSNDSFLLLLLLFGRWCWPNGAETKQQLDDAYKQFI